MRLHLLASIILALPSAAHAVPPPLTAATCNTFGGATNYSWGFNAWVPGAPGRAMLKRTLTNPSARCNDGSPAVMLLRPAPAGSPNAAKWIIHFDGGGGCRGGVDCLERWCGLGSNIFDQAAKMSSLGVPLGAAVQGGILNEVGGGPFSNWNHVLLPYCSSDTYLGSAPIGTAIDPITLGPLGYQIQFQGEAIVADMIATLRGPQTFADPAAAAQFYNTPMPSLANATQVIVSGDSAGSVGARHHVDRIASQLAGQTGLMVDAAYDPDLYKIGLNWGMSGFADYQDMMTREQVPVARGLWGVNDSALDQSCLQTAPTRPDLYCLDANWVLENHLATPFFVHQDLTDPMAVPKYTTWGIFINGYDFAVAVRDQLVTLQQNPGVEPRIGQPSMLGLNCNSHIASRSTNLFTNWRVSGLGGAALSFQTMLANWSNGMLMRQIQSDNPNVAGYTASVCP